jgi:phosphoribosyl-dephospho-CoA transferase
MISRHDLAWLTEAGWQRVLSSPGCPAELGEWAVRSLPLVGRRHEAGVGADMACLGAPLPPDRNGVKRRAAFTVPLDEVAHASPPLALPAAAAACAASMPPAWGEPLGELCGRLPGLRVYGSFAMQALTGDAYITAASDIDLLFTPSNPDELESGLRELQSFAQRLPLDGEVLFPSGDAVAWKEWVAAGPSARVLAKRRDTVRLARRDELLESWSLAPC